MDIEKIIDTLLKEELFSSKAVDFKPLTGGVSSDIYLIKDGKNRYVVKQARSKLKVRDDWYADTSRNEVEQDFIEYVQNLMPRAVPEMIYRDPEHSFFVMEYLGEGFDNWKDQLMQGTYDENTAHQVADTLATIHLYSWDNEKAKLQFDTTPNFKSLRIDPYLITTGERHPKLKDAFHEEAVRLENCRQALVHGDYSPKNIMVKTNRIVLLDHEVAWYGDPVFDISFLLNHIYLKMLFHHRNIETLPDLSKIIWRVYFSKLGEDKKPQLEHRIGRLLLMLMLARIDGKSPVEYFAKKEREKKLVRAFVYDLLSKKIFGQSKINSLWRGRIKKLQNEN